MINNRNSTTTKIYFQNINGLQEKQFHGRWTDQLEYMKKHRIEICRLAETNTDWDFKDTKNTLTNKTKKSSIILQ
jgi:hypothetical protein